MTTSPSLREMPLALPKVKSTSPLRTSSRLASKTARRRSGRSIASAGRQVRVQPSWLKARAGERVYAAREEVISRHADARSDLPRIHDGYDVPGRFTEYARDNTMARATLPTANACRK